MYYFVMLIIFLHIWYNILFTKFPANFFQQPSRIFHFLLFSKSAKLTFITFFKIAFSVSTLFFERFFVCFIGDDVEYQSCLVATMNFKIQSLINAKVFHFAIVYNEKRTKSKFWWRFVLIISMQPRKNRMELQRTMCRWFLWRSVSTAMFVLS